MMAAQLVTFTRRGSHPAALVQQPMSGHVSGSRLLNERPERLVDVLDVPERGPHPLIQHRGDPVEVLVHAPAAAVRAPAGANQREIGRASCRERVFEAV